MSEDGKLDWDKAEEHLKFCEEAYTEIGSAGLFALQAVIAPCRDRLRQGERSEQLYDEIMEISL